MTYQQPKALWLADALESRRELSPTHYINESASELRRLVVENKVYDSTIGYLEHENNSKLRKIVSLLQQRDELLAALKTLRDSLDPDDWVGEMTMHEFIDSVLAKATGDAK